MARIRYKPNAGPHITHTEAQTLEEAVSILWEKTRTKRAKIRQSNRKMSLRGEMELAKFRAKNKRISLSDRVQPSPLDKWREKNLPQKPPPPPELSMEKRRGRAIELYATGWFKPYEIGNLLKVNANQVKEWLGWDMNLDDVCRKWVKNKNETTQTED